MEIRYKMFSVMPLSVKKKKEQVPRTGTIKKPPFSISFSIFSSVFVHLKTVKIKFLSNTFFFNTIIKVATKHFLQTRSSQEYFGESSMTS